MKKLILILTLFISFSTVSQEIHSFYTLDVPRSKANDFVKMHKKFIDIYLMGSEENKMESTWLFAHTYGSDYTFKIIEVYPNIIAQASAVNYGGEVNKNIDAMDISYDDKKMLKDEWSTYFQLFIEGHDDEIRVTFDKQIFVTDKEMDFSKKHIVVFNNNDPKWSDRGEYISLWNQLTKQPAVDLGEALAIVPTGHFTGSSYSFQAAFWYDSWESFIANQKDLESSGPMSDDRKRMWDIGGSHNDEITTFLGSTRSNVTTSTKIFTIAK